MSSGSSSSTASDSPEEEQQSKLPQEGEDYVEVQQPPSPPDEEQQPPQLTTATSSPEVSPTDKTAAESNFAEQFDKMLQKYGEDYMRRVIEMSKQDTFTVALLKPTGKKEPDPLEPDKERDVYNGTEKKTYRRYPIGTGDYHRAEKLRAQFANEKDPDKVADNQARIYQFLAFCYLHMPYAEFSRVEDWTQIKLVVDACNHKTLYQPS